MFQLNNWAHVNYNSYKGKDSEYGWHCDATTQGENCDIKLTILINLSEKKYEGGDLKIFTGEEFTIPEFKDPGDTVMIKSPTYHKVTPIIKGERTTLAIFLRGPSLDENRKFISNTSFCNCNGKTIYKKREIVSINIKKMQY